MAGGGEITVNVEYLARSLMEKQEGAAPEERPHRPIIHRLSRVPAHLCDENNYERYYTPGFAAIGPFHDRAVRRLRPAERLKVAYLKSLVSRGHPDPAGHLAVVEDYVRVVTAREKEARAMYVNEEVANITAEDFVQMMVLDGCFIIEHLINVYTLCDEPELDGTPLDPDQLSVDLVLAENQMPFFVLVDLIVRTKLPEFEQTGYAPPVLLVKLVKYYLAGEKGRDMSVVLPAADGVSHILHLLHAMITEYRAPRWWSPDSERPLSTGPRLLRHLESLFTVPLLYRIFPEGPRRRERLEDYVLSASELKQMRVQFKKVRRRSGKQMFGIVSVLGPAPLAVTLYERQLQMSQLRIDYRTAPLLLNLMVFEQPQPAEVHLSRPQDVSSYVAFMAKLVQSAEDARVLAEAEVLDQKGTLGYHEELPRFFRLVGAASNATGALERSYLRVTLELLRRRSDSWVDLERNYFTVLAVILALVTFVSGVATIIQTYAALKYH